MKFLHFIFNNISSATFFFQSGRCLLRHFLASSPLLVSLIESVNMARKRLHCWSSAQQVFWKLLKILQVEPKEETPTFWCPCLRPMHSWCGLGVCVTSPYLFKIQTASVLRLAVLPYILPAPALSADSVTPSSSPVTLAALSPHSPSLAGQLIHFIVFCLCRSTLGGAFLPWTGCVWAYLLQRWATPLPNHTSFLLGSLRGLRCWCSPQQILSTLLTPHKDKTKTIAHELDDLHKKLNLIPPKKITRKHTHSHGFPLLNTHTHKHMPSVDLLYPFLSQHFFCSGKSFRGTSYQPCFLPLAMSSSQRNSCCKPISRPTGKAQ